MVNTSLHEVRAKLWNGDASVLWNEPMTVPRMWVSDNTKWHAATTRRDVKLTRRAKSRQDEGTRCLHQLSRGWMPQLAEIPAGPTSAHGVHHANRCLEKRDTCFSSATGPQHVSLVGLCRRRKVRKSQAPAILTSQAHRRMRTESYASYAGHDKDIRSIHKDSVCCSAAACRVGAGAIFSTMGAPQEDNASAGTMHSPTRVAVACTVDDGSRLEVQKSCGATLTLHVAAISPNREGIPDL